MASLKHLLNNQIKKTCFFVVLFFAFLAHGELDVLFWEIPDLNQLTVNEGKIRIYSVSTRSGSDTLYISKQNIPFNCGLPAVERRSCVPLSKIRDFQGKAGRVWWDKAKDIGWINNSRILQLEVNEI